MPRVVFERRTPPPPPRPHGRRLPGRAVVPPEPPVGPARSPRPRRPASPERPAPRPAPERSVPASPEALVGWADLARPGTSAARKRVRPPGLVEALPTLRFALGVLAVCAALTLYVAHQYASQRLAEEVQALRREQLRLVLQHNRLRGEYDQMTAPTVILRRADELGLRASADYGPTILVD